MKKNISLTFTTLCVALVLLLQGVSANEVQENPSLSLSGLVRFPFHFTMNTLADFPQTQIRVTETRSNTKIPETHWYQTYWYYGVPLSRLLEMAHVWKEDVEFKRLMDLAILVRGRNGHAVLSWPEICNANSKGAIIALRAEPVPPLTKEAPNKEVFPRLVLGDDFFADRFVDGVFNIEVINLAPPKPFKRGKHAYSHRVTITGDVPRPIVIEDLSSYGRFKVTSKQSGHDPGYFGVISYSGTSILEILKKEEIAFDANTVILTTSSDGYRASLSYGELALSSGGNKIILADQSEGKPFGEFGKFILICPDDHNADRWVKAVETIEIIRVRPKPRIYIVGVGCGDSDLLTMEGLSVFGKAQAFVCDQELANRFGRYMGNKPILYNPLENMAPYYVMTHPGVNLEKAEKIVSGLRDESVRKMRTALEQGKDVAFLEYGDPTIFGSWTYWLYEHFRPEEITVIPGVSAFNAANAALGKNVAANGSVVLTTPDGILGSEDMVNAVAAHGNTLAIFIGLQDLPRLVPVLKSTFGEKTPACLVYKAGYSNSEKVIRTDLEGLEEAARQEKEKFLGMIYVGNSLK
jgi:precorrin-4 methylase